MAKAAVCILLLFVAAAFEVGSTKKLPSALKRCRRSDPNFSPCLIDAILHSLKFFINGSPEYGIPQLEPFKVDKLDLGESNSGSVRLHQVYRNLNYYGMVNEADIVGLDVDFSGDNCHWKLNATTKKLRMEADYEMTGQLLLFPINGHGKCNNTMTNLKAWHEMKCEKYTKKGKQFLKVVSYKFDLEVGAVHFDFDNIIEGNQQLNDEVLKTLNENGLTVFDDIKASFANAFSQIWMNIGNNLFGKVPIEDVFLD